MRAVLITGAVALVGLAGGAAQAKSASQTCHAEANAAAYSGSKTGYAASYDEIYQACMGRQHSYVPQPTYQHRKHTTYVEAPQVACYPGAPTMYRGTLYCFD